MYLVHLLVSYFNLKVAFSEHSSAMIKEPTEVLRAAYNPPFPPFYSAATVCKTEKVVGENAPPCRRALIQAEAWENAFCRIKQLSFQA